MLSFNGEKNFALKQLCLTWVGGITLLLFDPAAWAAGKGSAGNPTSGGASSSCPVQGGGAGISQYTTPTPVRLVQLPQIGTKAFQMPNGVQADLNVDMQTILNTAVTSTAVLSPVMGISDSPCDSHLELHSAVTAFQLDLDDAGVSFGFSPAGAISTISSMTGSVNVKVGIIAMDFSLWKCAAGSCSSVAAASSNQLVAGTNLAFNIDFGAIKTGTALVFNSALGSVLRTIMMDALKKLSVAPGISELGWTSTVRLYNPVTGTLILGAGQQSLLQPNQTFEIYAPTDATPTGVCNVFQTVAYVHTTAVNEVSSGAVVDQILDPRGILAGDVVMIRNATKSGL